MDSNNCENNIKQENNPETSGPAETDMQDHIREEKKPDYLDQLQRLQAEFINYKKRVEKQQSEWHDYSLREVMNTLLPVVDDFEYLFQHHVDENEPLPYEGVRMVYNKLSAALNKMGLELISAEKEQFDPDLHEAVLVEHHDTAVDGEILQVWQKGYTFKGKLLRPARVKVAKKKDENV